MKVNFGYLLTISLVTALGGLLFGYDISVISGTIPFIQEVFQLDEQMKGWVVSSALLGCIAGAMFAGKLGDIYGRKMILYLTCIMFVITSVGCALANSVTSFVIFRIIGGLGVGGASVLAPMYIAEVSPGPLRGRMVSINQLTIVIGIAVAYYVNYILLSTGENAWRWMLAAETLPSVLFFVALFVVPESPRWLVARNKENEAGKVLQKVAGNDFARFELAEIKASLAGLEKRGTIHDALKRKYLFILFIGVFLAIFQQWSGINVIFFYAPDIFAKANMGLNDQLWQTALVGFTNVFFTILAMWVIDKIGRKVLMLVGAAGMGVCYLLIGYLFQTGKTEGWLLLSLLIATPAFFAFGLGPTVWVVLSEIFPNKIRGVAMSVSTFALWVACYLLTLTFPVFVEWLSAGITFWIYSAICIIGFMVIYLLLPETKGISLEQLEKKLVKE